MSDFGVLSQDYTPVTYSSFASIAPTFTAMNGTTHSAARTWPASNRAIYVPFVVGAPFLVQKITVCNVAPSGNIDVGVYDHTQNLRVSSGTTSNTGSNALQTFDVTDTTLLPGVYYMAQAMDNGTATFVAQVLASAAHVAVCGVLSQSTAFVLPSAATFAAAQDTYIPWITIEGRTVV